MIDHLITLYTADEGRFLSPRTMQTRIEHLNIMFGWMGDSPDDLREKIRDCTEYMLNSNLSRNTVIARRESLRLFFQWAIAQGHWKENNPVQKIRTLCSQPSGRRGMTEDEVEKLCLYDWPRSQEYWPLAILVGWFTGLRLADVALLEREALSQPGVLTLIPRKGRRFGVPLEIPIDAQLAQALSERVTEGGFFFPMMALHYQRDAQKTLSAQFSRAVQACGLSGISFHSLRHGVVTRLLEGGAPAAVVASITGHSMQVMARYSHPGMEAKREALGV